MKSKTMEKCCRVLVKVPPQTAVAIFRHQIVEIDIPQVGFAFEPIHFYLTDDGSAIPNVNAAPGDGLHQSPQPNQVAFVALSVGLIETLGRPEATHVRIRSKSDGCFRSRTQVYWLESQLRSAQLNATFLWRCGGSRLRGSRVLQTAAHLRSGRARKRLVLFSERLESLRVELFEIEQGVVCSLRRTDELIELDLNGLGVAVLCVLNQEDHQERHDRGSGVDDQLPRVAELE